MPESRSAYNLPEMRRIRRIHMIGVGAVSKHPRFRWPPLAPTLAHELIAALGQRHQPLLSPLGLTNQYLSLSSQDLIRL